MSTDNPYAAPTTVARDVGDEGAASRSGYYVVAPGKFMVMMIGTLSVYSIYWFYRQWAGLKKRFGSSIWPAPRAVFSIFFTHSLFEQIDSDLRARRANVHWNASSVATVFVAATFLGYVLERISSRTEALTWMDFMFMPLMVPVIWSLSVAQRAINQVEDDPQGRANARITGANIAWLVVGGIVWLLMMLMLMVWLGGVPIEAE